MNNTDFIVGLMKQGYNTAPCSLGFIPITRIQEYVASGQYVIQHDTRGRDVGYILHGIANPGGILHVTQSIIDVDHRNLGFGSLALAVVIARAKQANCRAIKLRCAEDLVSNFFWRDSGFLMTNTLYPVNKRRRAIHVYVMDLWTGLFNWKEICP